MPINHVNGTLQREPWFATQPFLHLVDFTLKETYHFARFEKFTRYYVLRLEKDLLDDWIIVATNGRIHSKLGQNRTIAFANFKEAFEQFSQMANQRYQKGYRLTTYRSNVTSLQYCLPFVDNSPKTTKVPVIKQSSQGLSTRQPSRKKISVPCAYQQIGLIF